MDQGWRFKGVAPTVKTYSLTDLWTEKHWNAAQSETPAEFASVNEAVMSYEDLKTVAKSPDATLEFLLVQSQHLTTREQSILKGMWSKSHK